MKIPLIRLALGELANDIESGKVDAKSAATSIRFYVSEMHRRPLIRPPARNRNPVLDYSSDQREEIVSLWRSGVGYDDIVKQVGGNTGRVSEVIRGRLE